MQAALLTIWQATNHLCSKRLVAIIPEMLDALDRFGHLSLPIEIAQKLLTMSSATIDRLLKPERQRLYQLQ